MDSKDLLYSKPELDLIKATFENNIGLLRLVRAVFFGMPLSAEDKDIIRSTFKPEIMIIMRKLFLPQITRDAPIGRNKDLWSELAIPLRDASQISQMIEANSYYIRRTEYGLGRLEEPDMNITSIVGYDPSETTGPLFADLVGRNSFITHVESRLVEIQTMATFKEQTEEERTKQAKQNSSE